MILMSRAEDAEQKLIAKDRELQEVMVNMRRSGVQVGNTGALEEKIFAQSAIIEELEQRIKLAAVEVTARDNKIELMRDESIAIRENLRSAEESVVRFRSTIEMLNAKILKFMQEKEDAEEAMDAVARKRESELANYQRTLTALEMQVQAKQAEVVWLTNSLQNAEGLLKGSSNPENSQILEHLTHECASKKITIDELTDELSIFKQANAVLKFKIANLEQNVVTKDEYSLVVKENQKLKEIHTAYETLRGNYDDILRRLEEAQASRREFFEKYDRETEAVHKKVEELSEENRQLLRAKAGLAKRLKALKAKYEDVAGRFGRLAVELAELLQDKERNMLELKTRMAELLKSYTSMEENQLKIEVGEVTEANAGGSKVFDGFTFNVGDEYPKMRKQPTLGWFEHLETIEKEDRFSFDHQKPETEEKGVQTYEEILKLTAPVTKPVILPANNVSRNLSSQFATVTAPRPPSSFEGRYKIITVNGRQEKVPITEYEYNNLINLPMKPSTTQTYIDRTIKKTEPRYTEVRPVRYSSQSVRAITKPAEVDAKQCDRFHCYCTEKHGCDVANLGLWKDHLKTASPYLYMNH